jgi:hypothetical protein
VFIKAAKYGVDLDLSVDNATPIKILLSRLLSFLTGQSDRGGLVARREICRKLSFDFVSRISERSRRGSTEDTVVGEGYD